MKNNNYDLHILHIDMDAFYASVEEVDNPYLKGKPVIVGGNKSSGIVTTANYEARKYGVHSAMPIFMAKQKCPHGFYLPTRINRYREVSNEVFQTLYEITDLIEPVSVDEAYLDISSLSRQALEIAQLIKDQVFKRTGLTMSVGISYNKFLAKLASDWNKPNGIKVIDHNMVPDILLPLPVKSVHGIGPKSAKKLNDIGIFTVKDLLNLSKDFIIDLFGKHGTEIYHRIRGKDDREISINRERKSLGTESTFSKGSNNRKNLEAYLDKFSKEISLSLKNKKIQGRTITLKVKYEDFSIRTKSKTLIYDTNDEEELFEWARILLDEINLEKKLRLIGLTVSNLSSSDYEQLSFI